MISAVLFDAVGTLIELREPVGETYARFAREHGMEIRPGAAQDAFVNAMRAMPPMAFPGHAPSAVYASEREWWRTVVRSVFEATGTAAPPAQFDACFYRLFCHFAGSAAWRAADGAADVLAALRRRGVRTGVVSNFDHRLRPLLDALGLVSLLDVIVLPSDVGAAKPDPRIFEYALEQLGVRAAEAIYVGDDADEDVAAAQRVGLRAVDVATLPDLRSLESLVA